MDELLETMCDLVERHCVHQRQATAVPGLVLYKIDRPLHPAHIMYNPRILVILRGSKTINLAEAPFEADARRFLLVTVDLPVTSHIGMAKDGGSHMALTLDLERLLLAEVLQKLPVEAGQASAPAGVVAATMQRALLEPLSRLVGLLDRIDDIAFLRPLIIQEIYFQLLKSGLGSSLTQFAMSSSHLSQISRATSWIKAHYVEAMSIEDLAEIAGMSVTSFHRHFKSITLMTPLQYRTQMRLQEARRMLLSEGISAGTAGLNVGYDSQSQFTRDYKRLFGAPPAMDTARLVGTPRAISDVNEVEVSAQAG